MKNTDKNLDFFKAEGKKLLQKNPEITPGEVRNILEGKYGKMHWKEDGSVPKKGEKGLDHKFKPMGRIKKGPNEGKKNTFQIESLEKKKNRNVTNTKNRKTAGDVQTVGTKDFPKVAKGSELEAHHKRGLNLYRPIYENLTDKQKLALSKWFVSKGFPLGEKLANADILPKGPHRHIHNFMEKEGYIETKLPNFKNMSLADRKAWATDNFLSWAKDTERKTISVMQEYRQQNPTKYQQLYKAILNSTKKIKRLSSISDVINNQEYKTEFIEKKPTVSQQKLVATPKVPKTKVNVVNSIIKSSKKANNRSGLSGVALDTNFMDDIVKQKPSTIYKTPRDTFFAPIPTRNDEGFLNTNFLPIDKV